MREFLRRARWLLALVVIIAAMAGVGAMLASSDDDSAASDTADAPQATAAPTSIPTVQATAVPATAPPPTVAPAPTETPEVLETQEVPSEPTPAAPEVRFEMLPPGSVLPTGEECAERVRPTDEIRSTNTVFNRTTGSSPHDEIPEVTGDFTGTTDEIIQWGACKWGVDEDFVRAQMAAESWWFQSAGGDLSADQSLCHPDVRTDGPTCPQSMGLSQIKYEFHDAAYEDRNVIDSTAYNVDYAYWFWRQCFNGEFTWLNGEDRGREYAAGDAVGCLGVWFWGRWYTPEGIGYMELVQGYLDDRVWETDEFITASEPPPR